jgi:hypothetical protein
MTLIDALRDSWPLLGAVIGASAVLLQGRAQRESDRRRDDETRARNESRIRAYFAALTTDLHEIVDLQTRTGGVWHPLAIKRPLEALRSAYENSELVLSLDTAAIHALGRSLADLRIATTNWEMGLEKQESDADFQRDKFKALFQGPKAALAAALKALGTDPAHATYTARA